MSDTPLHEQTLTDVAESIAAGAIDSVTVTETILERIGTMEPRLHAYYAVLADHARERAAELDAQRGRGEPLGPLHGVPIAVKDLCHKQGFATTGGHSFRRNTISETDATVVARLEAAGAVIVGKLATTEGAMVGYHRDFEVPRNPWGDLDRWPGVSSGGSGVATAAGLCFGSIGTDTGGSIRYPSAANGIVGLKPTWGRVSRHGVLDLAPTLDHVGPMTRSVRDAARMLSVIAGHDAKDPTSLPNPVPDYEAGIDDGVAGLRIGWDAAWATRDVETHVAKAVWDAVELFAELGANIVDIKMPDVESELAAWTTIAAAEAAAVHADTWPSQATEYGAMFSEFLQIGSETTGAQLASASFQRELVCGKIAPVFDGIDLILSPTIAAESFRYDPADAWNGMDPDKGTWAGVPFEFFNRNARFIMPWDFNGYPTLSMPCGLSEDGIPMSLQLVGGALSEGLLCIAGCAFEQASRVARLDPN